MKTEATPLDKCPYCGSEKDAFHKEHLADQLDYECGTWKTTLFDRTKLCRERERVNKLQAELAVYRDLVWKYEEISEELIDQGHFDRCDYLTFAQGKCNCGIGKLERLDRQSYKTL